MLEGMHLVEATRACAAFTKQSATNASHTGCLRSLCRMALSLLYNNEEKGNVILWYTRRRLIARNIVLRKPFISLARMVLWSEMYSIGDVDPENPSFVSDNEVKLELRAARAAIEVVLAHNDVNLEAIQPKDFKEFEWLARGEVGEDWKDPGTATVAIPEVRRFFRGFEDTEIAQSTSGNTEGNA